MVTNTEMDNYFTSVEERFTSQEGISLVLSNREFMVIADWREKGIPLEIVLKGIDRFFEENNNLKRKRKVRLKNCEKYIFSLWDEKKEASLGTNRNNYQKSAGFDEILKTMSAAILTSSASLSGEKKEMLLKASGKIVALIESKESDINIIEKNLICIEKEIIDYLIEFCDDKETFLLKAKRETADLCRNVNRKTAEKIISKRMRNLVRESHSLPELTLFPF